MDGLDNIRHTRRVTTFVDGRSAEVKAAAPDRQPGYERRFWAAVGLMDSAELLRLATYVTANDSTIQQLVVTMRDPCNGMVAPVNARTCTNELGACQKNLS